MDIRNVKNVDYFQVNEEILRIVKREGVEILKSPEAWKRYKWTRKYFAKKPKGGFFIWVKKDTGIPITTCVSIDGKNVKQSLDNLVVIEKGVHAKSYMICNSTMTSNGIHKAGGKIIVKEGSILETSSVQAWSDSVKVFLDYEYVLEKNSKIVYNFKLSKSPQTFSSKTKFVLMENSSLRERTIIDNRGNTKAVHKLEILLKGKDANAISQLRAVGRDLSSLISDVLAIGENKAKAHLDCQGLVIGKRAKMKLIPSLFIKNKEALLTHEASIGRIVGEQLDYLRSRGLTEREAINLIVSGFLTL